LTPLLIDSDVLIEYLRGRKKAQAYLTSQQSELRISAMTVAELYSGVRGQAEQQVLGEFIESFVIIDISKIIAMKGGLIRNQYGPSHGVGLADALIAATSIDSCSTLVTFNKKHYPMLGEVIVPYRRQ